MSYEFLFRAKSALKLERDDGYKMNAKGSFYHPKVFILNWFACLCAVSTLRACMRACVC